MSRLLQNRLVQILGGLFILGLVLYRLGFQMARTDLHISAAPEALGCLGGVFVEGHCASGIPFTNSLLMTIVVDLVLLGLAFFGLRNMQLIPRGIQNMIEIAVEMFYNFAVGIDRENIKKFFPLPATIFFFFLVANILALVPGVGSIGACVAEGAGGHSAEVAASSTLVNLQNWPGSCGEGTNLVPFLRAPAADLNVTFAIAIVAVFMVEFFGIQALGLRYFTRFFNFKEGFLGAFVGIIELISEVSRVVSFAFRIFGNIFGGEVILAVMAFLFPYILPLPFYGFELFVAFIQAFIFAVLTLVFMSNATVAHGEHEEDHPEHGHADLVPEVE